STHYVHRALHSFPTRRSSDLFHEHHNSLPMEEGRAYRLTYSVSVFLRYNNPVDYYFNVMRFVPINLHFGYEVHHLSIYACFSKSHFSDLLKEFSIMPFSTFDHWSQERQFFTVITL